LQAKADLIGDRSRRRGERLAQESVQKCRLGRCYRVRATRFADQPAQLSAEWLTTRVEDTGRYFEAGARQLDKSGIDALAA
jgi:hypothetical protein